MIVLSKEQIISIHAELVHATGGSIGIRDEGLLESAINAPFQTFDNKDLYHGLLQKAAVLGYSLIANHPFIDGNKRIGVHAMLVFLAINGIELSYTQQELIDVGLKTANNEFGSEDILKWIVNHN